MIRPTTIRVAQNHEGEIIRDILATVADVPGPLDWSRVWPNWLLAEHKGVICGTIQVLPGYPMGHIGCLAILPRYRKQGIAAYLSWAAEELLRRSGVSGLTFTSNDQKLIEALERHGAQGLDETVRLMFKPVRKKLNESTKST
jgi:GNAT superfamily N-acetyltransferase